VARYHPTTLSIVIPSISVEILSYQQPRQRPIPLSLF